MNNFIKLTQSSETVPSNGVTNWMVAVFSI